MADYFRTYSVRDSSAVPGDVNVATSATVHEKAVTGYARVFLFPDDGTVTVRVGGVAQTPVGPAGERYLYLSAGDVVTCVGGEIAFRVTLENYTPEKPYGYVNYVAFGDSLTAITRQTPIGQSEQAKLNYVYFLKENRGINVMNEKKGGASAVRDGEVCHGTVSCGRDGTDMAYSGTGYVQKREQAYGWYNRARAVPHDADIITVFGSVNDISIANAVGSGNPAAYATSGCTVTRNADEGIPSNYGNHQYLRAITSAALDDTRSDNTVAGEFFDVWRELHRQAPFAAVTVVPGLYAAGIGSQYRHTINNNKHGTVCDVMLRNSVRTTLLLANLFKTVNGDWFDVYNFTYDLDADDFTADTSEGLYNGRPASYYDFRKVNPWLFGDDVTDADLAFAVTYSDIRYATVAAFTDDFEPIHPLTAYYEEYLWHKFDEAVASAPGLTGVPPREPGGRDLPGQPPEPRTPAYSTVYRPGSSVPLTALFDARGNALAAAYARGGTVVFRLGTAPDMPDGPARPGIEGFVLTDAEGFALRDGENYRLRATA